MPTTMQVSVVIPDNDRQGLAADRSKTSRVFVTPSPGMVPG